MSSKKKFFGSFGQKHPFGGTHVQPIVAESHQHAEKAMAAQYERNWCMVYAEKTFEGTTMTGHERLPTIEVTDYGTEGYENLGFSTL